ncbi:hypothetical protein [Coralloluteibacterium thermophilus]|uniref:Lipoprotein n=1 Tax=Coralloluteibacterium thermophilum TaxID=2707049 RepID=A0ABV9NMU5_9GAMM
MPRLPVLLVAALLAAGCAPAPTGYRPAPDNEAACLADGGTWARHGRLGVASCARPTHDAGRTCRDGSECASACLAPEGVEPGTATTGTCHVSDRLFGCHTRVTDGHAAPTICID